MTSPHPQREEAARLWPEYNTPKPRSFVAQDICTGIGIGSFIIVIFDLLSRFFQ